VNQEKNPAGGSFAQSVQSDNRQFRSYQQQGEILSMEFQQNNVRLRYGGLSAIRTSKKNIESDSLTPNDSAKSIDEKTIDDYFAALDGETTSENELLMTELDRRLAAALVSRGILNRWQTAQLLEGRTKFTLGKYWILNAIGKGGYGHVFLGCEYNIDMKKGKPNPPKFLMSDHAEYKPPVALKVLPLAKSTEELSERFRNEITLQKRLRHPNLVRFIDSGHDGNVDYMVHEFIDGGDVKTLLQKEGVIPYDIAAAIIVELSKGVQYLHDQGIIHRDIKPANILISSVGKAKLIDLGLSVSYDVNREKTKAEILDEGSQFERAIDKMNVGKIAGTIDYVAPDQIRNPNEPSPAWDIYSIGCLFYQLLTGRTPFPKGDLKQKLSAHVNMMPTDPRVFNQLIPYDVSAIVLLMLEKTPSKRIQSAREIVEKLSAWIPPDGLAGQLICATEYNNN
jgi:hypothetical protein